MTDADRAPGRSLELERRIVSGVVMVVAALAAAWAGGLVFALFWTLAGVAVGVEWAWLAAAEPRARRWAARVVAATLGVAGVCVGLSGYLTVDPLAVAAILVAGAAIAAVVARPTPIAAFGVPYGAAAFVGIILLRQDPQDGLLAVFWLFAVVWATDVAAFFVGRAVGGPKLAPGLSPKKTWSGAIGGLVAAVAAGVSIGALAGAAKLWPLALVAFAAAVAAEIGDLFESGVKRAFGAKDSSKLIPGHGGLMDRLDGFLVAATLCAAIGIARGGLDGAGQGLIRW